ncbi:YhgE/Pip domain-containing protein [Sutcliffiella halmapala]|uniref:YhgE/Pip domain-containing protein n=1 Tax=Sutcliffiella halmapala TaxID=79882 RepID=UPI00099555CA|nr:ABC transporter permease [Sutcliffiella halmapala]
MMKNKLFLLAPIIALTVIFIFSLTLIPTVQPTPKNLPIALVNEDQGFELPNQARLNIGQTIVDMIHENGNAISEEVPTVNWIEMKSYEEVVSGLNDQLYYAALIIPSDFSEKQVSLRTPSPATPELHIYINQGMNTMASTVAGQILNGIVENMNNQLRTQALEEFTQQGESLTAEQALSLVTPVAKIVTNVNEIGTNSANGNAPVSLFQPLWMASVAGAAIIFLAMTKLGELNRKETLVAKFIQIMMGAILAFTVGFGLTWLADGLLGLHIPQVMNTALFLTLTYFCYFLMISAVLSWLGIRGIALFVLALFFGGPLLALAPEFMSPFYRDWIYSWLPMRFMVEGLRELLFFGKGLGWNSATISLAAIGAGGALLVIASAFKKNPATAETTQQNVS